MWYICKCPKRTICIIMYNQNKVPRFLDIWTYVCSCMNQMIVCVREICLCVKRKKEDVKLTTVTFPP